MKSVLGIVLLITATLITLGINVQDNSKEYKQAIGGRLGLMGKQSVYSDIDFLAVSYKRNLTRKSAFEANLGWGLKPIGATQTVHGISLSTSYHYHFLISNTGLRPFIGAGAIVIYSTGKKSEIRKAVNEVAPGIYPILGIDYKTCRNFNIAIDLRPTNVFNKNNPNTHQTTKFTPYAGLTFRRTF